tara:strand:- start:1671 stop:1955 length:285 start_codon:yes stop_codon:yes gene_type:complete
MHLVTALYHPSIPRIAINRKSPTIAIDLGDDDTGALGIMLPGLPISPGKGLSAKYPIGGGVYGLLVELGLGVPYAPTPLSAACCSGVNKSYTSF